MNLQDRIEKNANIMLWSIHVAGPDDVHAAPSHKEAVEQARIWNEALYDRIDDKLDEILCFSYAAPWPYDEESHAHDIKSWPEKMSDPKKK